MSAMSDYRIAYDEAFRFEELIVSLSLPEMEADEPAGGGVPSEDDSVWEARAASMVLVNALTTAPKSLEERIFLREEFGRRGINEVIAVSTYHICHW